MRRDDRSISASEIGTWCYCKKAWHLSQSGHPPSQKSERLGSNITSSTTRTCVPRANSAKLYALSWSSAF